MIVFSERDDHPQSKWTSLLQKMSHPLKEENFSASVNISAAAQYCETFIENEHSAVFVWQVI